MRDPAGAPIGYAYAAQTLDPAFVAQLVGGDRRPGHRDLRRHHDRRHPDRRPPPAASPRTPPALTGEPDRQGPRPVRAADRPDADQPLAVAMSVPVKTIGRADRDRARGDRVRRAGRGRRGLGAGPHDDPAAATRSPRRPIGSPTATCDTRVPVRHDDEVGQVGAAFNRMSREMQSYATALTASRDQLRGNLDVLGDTLASTHDLPRILQVILASARSPRPVRRPASCCSPIRATASCGCSARGLRRRTRSARLEPLVVTFGAGLVGDGRRHRGGSPRPGGRR